MKALTKSRDKVLAGVCGGIGRYFNIDPALVRVGFVTALFLGIGMPIMLYLVLALVLPEEA